MENHCCLSLSKCVNDQLEFKHRRLRGKSMMASHTEYFPRKLKVKLSLQEFILVALMQLDIMMTIYSKT